MQFSFLELPLELQYQVIYELDTLQDVFALMRVSRHIYTLICQPASLQRLFLIANTKVIPQFKGLNNFFYAAYPSLQKKWKAQHPLACTINALQAEVADLHAIQMSWDVSITNFFEAVLSWVKTKKFDAVHEKQNIEFAIFSSSIWIARETLIDSAQTRQEMTALVNLLKGLVLQAKLRHSFKSGGLFTKAFIKAIVLSPDLHQWLLNPVTETHHKFLAAWIPMLFAHYLKSPELVVRLLYTPAFQKFLLSQRIETLENIIQGSTEGILCLVTDPDLEPLKAMLYKKQYPFYENALASLEVAEVFVLQPHLMQTIHSFQLRQLVKQHKHTFYLSFLSKSSTSQPIYHLLNRKGQSSAILDQLRIDFEKAYQDKDVALFLQTQGCLSFETFLLQITIVATPTEIRLKENASGMAVLVYVTKMEGSYEMARLYSASYRERVEAGQLTLKDMLCMNLDDTLDKEYQTLKVR